MIPIAMDRTAGKLLRIIAVFWIFFGALLHGQNSAVAQSTRTVSLELVLAVDASSSVDATEYALQVAGYVKAFQDEEVIAAIGSMAPYGIAVTYVEWSSRWKQTQTVEWTQVFDRASSRSFARAIERSAKNQSGSGTAIGEAIFYSAKLFRNNGFTSDRKIIDISADDRYNAGTTPSYARDNVVKNGIVVNGLAIDETGFLAEYFRDNVIGGPGSFVVSANSFQDFAASIKLKLLMELAPHGPISRLYVE